MSEKILNHRHRTGEDANGFKHGHAGRNKVTPEYKSWSGLRNRCLNPKNPKYRIYGGRGIKVCERWDDFNNFLSDMGRKPSQEYSIERLDRNGNYEPGNCIWATQKTQQRNRSTNRILTFNGESKTMTDWAIQFGLEMRTLWNRLKMGWDLEDALKRPLRRTKANANS